SSDIDDITDTDDTIVSDKQPEEADPNAQTGTNNNNTQQGLRDDKVKEYLRKWFAAYVSKDPQPKKICLCIVTGMIAKSSVIKCYGIVHLPAPDEPWYCDRCLAKPSETVICALCPRKTGAFRRMKEGDAAGTW
ncbi:15850_t:CDS:2, partial [Acaulospora morrowiae]